MYFEHSNFCIVISAGRLNKIRYKVCKVNHVNLQYDGAFKYLQER